MPTQPRNKLAVIAATGLVIMALASTSARASHDHNVVAPLVTGFALGALLNYGHSSHHYYRYQYQRHGHSRRSSGHGYGYGSGHGYSSHNNNSYHKKSYSKGNSSHKPRHSSSRGNRHTPRRKH